MIGVMVSRPPPAAWGLEPLPYQVPMPEADARAIAGAVGLPLKVSAAELGAALVDVANAWWRMCRLIPLDAPMPGAPPSERAAYCRGVAKAAEALLLALGANVTHIPVSAQHSADGRLLGPQIDPFSALADGIENLAGPRVAAPDVEDALWRREAEVELHYAPLLAAGLAQPRPARCGLPEAVGVDEEVLKVAVAGVALLRARALISADAYDSRASFGGRKSSGARLHAFARAARVFEWAFGVESWSAPKRGWQLQPYECMAALFVALAGWMARSAGAETLAKFRADGPRDVSLNTARRLAIELRKVMARPPARARRNLPGAGEVSATKSVVKRRGRRP
ncbi:hypothetical protein [Elioraea sp.]|uniref:hypothetical protein n=1 Tax=Elioraea sp. TaxID=2185103 RepID=UPI003F70554B